MIRRLTLSLFSGALLTASLVPASASAHGPLRRGYVIEHNIAFNMTTSNCACDEKWFTMGLRPGTVSITATIQNCHRELSPACGLTMFFFRARARGQEQLKMETVGCSTSKSRCGKSVQLSYRVSEQGVYYVLVRGSGSTIIHYRVRVRGNLYVLNCQKYC